MPNRIILLLPAIFLAVALSAGASLAERAGTAGNDCLAKPGSQAAEGRRWYYRIDRSSNRRCWYLGDAGTKVRKASVLKRRSALKRLSQRNAGAKSEAISRNNHAQAIGADAITEFPAGESESADFFTRWPNYVRPAATIDREPAAMRNSYADEHSAKHSTDDMPLIWPILNPAEVTAAAPPARSTFNSEIIYGMIAGALGASLLARTVLNIVTRRRLRRRDPLEQLPAAASMAKPRLHVRPTGAVAAARQPGGARKPNTAARRAAIGQGFPNKGNPSIRSGQALDPPQLSHRLRHTASRPAGASAGSNAGQDIEQSLRQLLAGWQRTTA